MLCEGPDAAIFAIGNTVAPVLAAAALLKEQGITVTVVNSRFVKPLDEKLICSLAQQTGCIITVEENVLSGGFGSAVLEGLEQNGIAEVHIKRIGLPDKFIEYGAQSILREKYGLDKKGIFESVKEFLAARNPKKVLPKVVTIK